MHSSAVAAQQRIREAKLAERLTESVGALRESVQSGELAASVSRGATSAWQSASTGAKRFVASASAAGSTLVDTVAKSVTETPGMGHAMARQSRYGATDAATANDPAGAELGGLPGIDSPTTATAGPDEWDEDWGVDAADSDPAEAPAAEGSAAQTAATSPVDADGSAAAAVEGNGWEEFDLDDEAGAGSTEKPAEEQTQSVAEGEGQDAPREDEWASLDQELADLDLDG